MRVHKYHFRSLIIIKQKTPKYTGPDGAVVMGQWDGRYWIRISVPAPTQSGVFKAAWVVVRPLHPLLCHLQGGLEGMFYLTTHSTHFIYGYMASDIW